MSLNGESPESALALSGFPGALPWGMGLRTMGILIRISHINGDIYGYLIY
jgi:hypothetical protein